MYYLFLNYNQYIGGETEREENLNKLESAVAELPEYLSSRIKY